MRSICLLGVQVAVEGKGWMVLAIDNHDYGIFTGLPVRPSYKFGFRSSVQKNGLPGEGRHEGLVPRNDVLTNGS